MIYYRWDEYTWWLNFYQIHQSSSYRVYRLYAICSRTVYASSGITSVKINFPSLCSQNLISWICTESALCSLWWQWFWSGSSQPKTVTSNPGPRCMLCGQEHSTENWASCLASWRLGHKQQFCSEHQLLGQAEPQPRKRNTECLEWSGVIYCHCFDFLIFFLIYLFFV